MKNKNINYLVLIVIAAFSFGCKGTTVDPVEPVEPTALELQLETLMNDNTSWGTTGGKVMKDGYDVSNQFNGFTLSFGEFTYTAQGGLTSAWPSSGSWQFLNDNPNKISRNDGVEMDVVINNNQLTLTFNVTGIGGRVKGIDGAYTFSLSSN